MNFDALKAAIEGATNWKALDKTLDDVQAAFEQSTITRAQAEALAHVSAKQAHLTPEKEKDEPPRISDLLKDSPTRIIRSTVLGEDILIARNDAEIPKDNKLVVYRQYELSRITDKTPAVLRKIHEVKKEFDGEITNL